MVLLLLAINGSPRLAGNTAYLLLSMQEVVESLGAGFKFLQVTEILAGQKVPFCVACSHPCEGKCYQGTRLAEAFDIMRGADAIIIGSPVYFGAISAPLKALWDKTRVFRREKALLNIVGGAVAVGGVRFGGQELTVRGIQDLMLSQGMTVVGDWWLEDEAGHMGVCAQSPANKDAEGLERIRVLAKRVVEVARATQGLRRKSR